MKVTISKEWVTEAMQSPGVRKQLKAKADSVAYRARQLAEAERVDSLS